ncbi:Gfo/Idh/MocA family protein [Luethyella okanaganae]|uniref:Inositol 2-dehydrogenase n=1 Tax=Luethyella okanaganae TaxID=69372 RepID=A0ABW1VCG1_9MICO
MTETTELRIGVVGAGLMGADHVTRINHRVSGATVTAIVEPDEARASAAVAQTPGAVAFRRIEDAIEADAVDAVLVATPGRFHEPVLLPALEAKLAILCEKPLTPDSESSLRVLEAEQRLDRPHIQVGFMRRFDPEYIQLRRLVESGDAGGLITLHCAHRNQKTGEGYVDSMLITDSVVHEFDIVPWLVGSPIASVEVRKLKRNTLAPSWLNDPQFVMIETESGVLANVEINVNIQFGYQVATEAVFEKGVAQIGRSAGIGVFRDGSFQVAEHQDFRTRFSAAYDTQVQRWVDAVKRGEIDGPSAWDGYRVAAACEAGVEAQATGRRVDVNYIHKPAFYA